MNTIPTHYKSTECDLQSAFTLFGAGGEEIQLIPTNLSASSSITINASKTIIESASAALNSSFTQTTVNSRRRGGVVALNTTCTVSVTPVRITPGVVALNSAFTQTAELSDAPFEFAIQGVNSYTIHEMTGTGLVVDWGNGTQTIQFDAVTPTGRGTTYPSSGSYTIKITGNLTSIRLGNDGADTFKVLGVTRFNNNLQSFSMRHTDVQISRTENLFTYAPNVIPNSITNLSYAFWQCNNFNQNINAWNTSNVTNMRDMFSVRGTIPVASYNQPLNNWDTSNVTDMQNMFREQADFNQPLNNWDTSLVTNMTNMFSGASDYDQDISTWCVENIPTKPTGFDTGTTASWTTAEKPNWGAPC
jgi:surface protein